MTNVPISINTSTDSYDVQRRLDAEQAAQSAANAGAAAAPGQDQQDLVTRVQVRDQNLRASASRLEDVDAAAAAVNAAAQQISAQGQDALAAQANLDPRNVLDLLRD